MARAYYDTVVDQMNDALLLHFKPFPVRAVGWWNLQADAYMIMLVAEMRNSLNFSSMTFPG